jgi:hypothetical protein
MKLMAVLIFAALKNQSAVCYRKFVSGSLVIFVLYVYCEASYVLCRILVYRNIDCLLRSTEILVRGCLCKNWQLRVCDSEETFVAK